MGRVVEIHPEANSVDLLNLSDGHRLTNCRLLTGCCGTDFGGASLIEPDSTGFDSQKTNTRDIYAIFGFIEDYPVVFGFLYPMISQCLFDEKGRMIYRHGSDVYWTVDSNGNAEFSHPSGAFVRIGQSPAHEDLTGKDNNRLWKIKRNKEKAVHIHVEQAGGACKFDIDPSGNVTLSTNASIKASASGYTEIESPNLTAVVSGKARFDTPLLECTGDIKDNCDTPKARTMAAMREKYDAHTHNENDYGGPTDPPNQPM
jgi:hypothetical protein